MACVDIKQILKNDTTGMTMALNLCRVLKESAQV